MLKTVIALLLLSVSGALYAQPRLDCSKAKDPKACEERLAKAKAARDKARQVCQGKAEEERRDCMRREMCAQAADPAKCEAQVKERIAQRAKIREACKGKTGEELRACIREQRKKT